jgi:hypothetical protein
VTGFVILTENECGRLIEEFVKRSIEQKVMIYLFSVRLRLRCDAV